MADLESVFGVVPYSFVESADYTIAKILGLFCSRCERVTTPYVSESMRWPCCNGCWHPYPENQS